MESFAVFVAESVDIECGDWVMECVNRVWGGVAAAASVENVDHLGNCLCADFVCDVGNAEIFAKYCGGNCV